MMTLPHPGSPPAPGPRQRLLFVRVVTLLLGVVFLASAYLKAIKPAETITSLGMFFGDQSAYTGFALYALIFGEMILAGALLANIAPRRTLRVSIAALLVFTVWIGYLLSIGWTKGCGCGSWTPNLDPTLALWLSLGRNIFLLAFAFAALKTTRSRRIQADPSGNAPAETDTRQSNFSKDPTHTSAFDV